MKLKLDENLPVSLAGRLRALGHDVDTVRDEGLTGRDDDTVWAAAQAAGRFLVTQDLDFSDVRRFAPGTHHGLLIARVPEGEQWRIADHILAWFALPETPSWERCLVVATPVRVRVVRAPPADPS